MTQGNVDAARRALSTGERVLTKTWRQLRQGCRRADGSLDADALDRDQLVCYEGAISAAELTAAHFALHYAAEVARRAPTADTLETRLALTYAAEQKPAFAFEAGFAEQAFDGAVGHGCMLWDVGQIGQSQFGLSVVSG